MPVSSESVFVIHICLNCRKRQDLPLIPGGGAFVCPACDWRAEAPEAGLVGPGMVLGDYLLTRFIGRGGTATVFLGEHLTEVGQQAAIKVLLPEVASNPKLVANFIREATVASGFKHPNIIQILSIAESQGFHYAAMEYVDGLTLTQVLDGSGRIGIERALSIASRVTAALKFVWEVDTILHNDIKPDNIMITAGNNVKLTDLGLAAKASDLAATISGNAVLGTPAYISPERLMGGTIDFRSDLYSLGATLYHLLTNRIPFPGDSLEEVSRKHLCDTLVPPHLLIPEIGLGISHLIQLLLAKRPEHRFASFDELLNTIEQVQMGMLPRRSIDAAAQQPFYASQASNLVAVQSLTDTASLEATRALTTNQPGSSSFLHTLTWPFTVAIAAFKDVFRTWHPPPPPPPPKAETEFDAAVTMRATPAKARPWWETALHPMPKQMVFEAVDAFQTFQALQLRLANNEIALIEIPENIQRIVKLLNDKEFNYPELIALISRSPGLTGEFLYVANSAHYNRGVPISDLRTALPRISPGTIKSMLYLNMARNAVSTAPEFREISKEIINHSMQVASIASYLAQWYYFDPDSAFVAGLLHDIGKIAILRELCTNMELPKNFGVTITEATFDEILPVMHEKAGHLLACHWRLPAPVCAAVRYHHTYYNVEDPGEDDGCRLLPALIAMADLMARMLGKGRPLNGVNLFQLPVLEVLGATEDAATIEFLSAVPTLVKRVSNS